MIIDITKISPVGRYRVLDAVRTLANKEARQIEKDLELWKVDKTNNSQAYEEMQGWAKAFRDLDNECNRLIYLEKVKV